MNYVEIIAMWNPIERHWFYQFSNSQSSRCSNLKHQKLEFIDGLQVTMPEPLVIEKNQDHI